MAAMGTEEILVEEAREIHGVEKAKTLQGGAQLNVALNELDGSALCLSGGGIRSAMFSLGVVQALASHPRSPTGNPVASAEASLLARFNYLSTVSGGGYIGSFISAWLLREHRRLGNGWPAVWSKLKGRVSPEEESKEISWLRTYSNYLTPRLGLASADLWAAVAIFVRNLVLNWLVIVPPLCAVLLALKLFALWVGQLSIAGTKEDFYILGACGVLTLSLALIYTNWSRPTHARCRAGQGLFIALDLGPAVASALLFCLTLATTYGSGLADGLFHNGTPSWSGVLMFSAAGFFLFAVCWLASWPRLTATEFMVDWLAWSISGLIYGVLMALGICLYFGLVARGLWFEQPKEILLLVCGPPWAFLSQLLGEMVFVGLSSYQAGSDSDREWLGRSAGWYIAVALSWLTVMFLVFLGSALADQLYGQITTWVAGGGAAVVTAFLGKSSSTGAGQPTATKSWVSKDLILGIAAVVVAISLIVGLSGLLDQLVLTRPLLESVRAMRRGESADFSSSVVPICLALFASLAVGLLASKFVNINRFSLHALYRNRIIRAFLGASNPTRSDTRNKFTDFDETDNVRVASLWPGGAGSDAAMANQQPEPAVGPANWRPFHVVNMALNVVSTSKLAWQERKAESFSVSPLHSGSSYLGYRRSSEYGDSNGISLGTAVAISGAAASPNMGYHSSPAVAFLMTMLNVRLGWWLGNPGPAGESGSAYGKDGPPTAIKPLVCEMFGQTTDQRSYVYLSDGGHFENLGLYEMVRRRCRFIVAVDAGCDKDFAFEDLGNAVRKISIDLGVKITFRGLDNILFRAEKDKQTSTEPPFHAIGRIHYRDADGGGEDGLILYVKPAFHSLQISNVGVRNYAVAHPEFPHESTGDQWFSESQLESYRALGFEITDSILVRAFEGKNFGAGTPLSAIFASIAATVPD